MNRKARRAAAKQAEFALSPAVADRPFEAAKADDIYAPAISHYRKGEFVQAENLCRLALSREPRHLRSLVLLGDVVQQGGRNKLAVKLLSQALELDRTDAAGHDNIAIAYQALGRMNEAVAHFTHAMALGLRDPEILVKQSAAVTAPLKRLADAWPRQLPLAELLGAKGASAMAREAMLLALLQSKVVHDLELERLLTAIRRGLLQHAIEADRQPFDDDGLEFFCALAQQCFLNEYVFALGDIERAELQRVHDRIVAALEAGAEIAALDLIVTASYLPLHKLPGASSLLTRSWPDAIERLLTQQIREPLEEESDRNAIPVLTPIDDAVSLQVQNQYEESPYPRWTAVPQIEPTTVVHFLRDRLNIVPMSWPQTDRRRRHSDRRLRYRFAFDRQRAAISESAHPGDRHQPHQPGLRPQEIPRLGSDQHRIRPSRYSQACLARPALRRHRDRRRAAPSGRSGGRLAGAAVAVAPARPDAGRPL